MDHSNLQEFHFCTHPQKNKKVEKQREREREKKKKKNTTKTEPKQQIMSEPRRRVYFPMTILLSLALLLIHTHFSLCNGVSVLDLNSLKMGEIERMEKRVCSSSKIGDCLAEMETEMEMDSEINRRVLTMQKKFISYETLRRDMIPCARAGAPYYNCHVGPANPYSRGCEVISGCRGIIN